jgi:DNA-binding MarR family transcriptional regulator
MTSQDSVSTIPDALREVGTLVLLVRAVDQRLRAGTGPDALTLAELGVLGQVARGLDSPSVVARTLRLDPARVTHLVDRLVEHGSVTRGIDPDDRRRWRLEPTTHGLEALADGRAAARTAMEALLDGLTAAERDGLALGLEGARRVLLAEVASTSG